MRHIFKGTENFSNLHPLYILHIVYYKEQERKTDGIIALLQRAYVYENHATNPNQPHENDVFFRRLLMSQQHN